MNFHLTSPSYHLRSHSKATKCIVYDGLNISNEIFISKGITVISELKHTSSLAYSRNST